MPDMSGELVMGSNHQSIGFHTIHRRNVHTSIIATTAQPQYPTALRCKVTQNILVPHGQEDLKACQILGPSSGSINLRFLLKFGNQLIGADSFIDSSILYEIISELNRVVKQDTNSIKGIGEDRLISDIPNACCVPLEFCPLEGALKQSMENYKPLGTIESIDLELKYALHRKKSQTHQTFASLDEAVSKIDFDSLIHVQPLALPLKSSIRKFITRFINHNLLKQLPLVFNSHWQQSLQESLPKQALISRVVTRLSLQSISDDLRVELNLQKTEEDGQAHRNEEVTIRELSRLLLEIQLRVGKIPNTRISRTRRVARSPSSISHVSSEPDGMDLDDLDHNHQLEDSLWEDQDSEAFSNLEEDQESEAFADMSGSDVPDYEILSN